MKFFSIVVLLLIGLLLPAHAQQEADAKYLGIYGLLQQADNLAGAGDPGEALAAYSDVQSQLQQFQKWFPDWNPKIISFRLNRVGEKIAELKDRSVAAPVAKKDDDNQKPVTSAAPVDTQASANLQLPTELDNLRTQLQVAQVANGLLQSQIKEALAVQPSAVDPRELARAQEKIRSLMKEIDLLNASRSTLAPAKEQPQFVTNLVKIFVTNNPAPVVKPSVVSDKNVKPVVITNYVRVIVPDTNALEMVRLERAAAVKSFNEEHERAEKLAVELSRLKSNSSPVSNEKNALDGLREENARLKSELAALRATPSTVAASENSSADLKRSQALVVSLQSDVQIATLEKMALQRKLQQLLEATNSGVNVADYESRIRELTQERNRLIEKLDTLAKQKSGGKTTEAAAQVSALSDELGILRSRLALAEAQPVPYTADELALFKTTVPPPANPDANKKSISEMPTGTAELVASAQRHFAQHEFDAAESDYVKILERDQNNGIALANLATIELQQGKLADAEKHITAAVAQSPDDAYNLSTLGYLKFRQEKYDDALNILSRAAQVAPNDPEIQNYLGVTLSHKGQRKQAETALRRAIQLSPAYAPAHNNLAVIYLSQQPPLAELARWHYQKALDAGQPRNPDLEKMLADKGAPVAQ